MSFVKIEVSKVKFACEEITESIAGKREEDDREYEKEWLRSKNFWRKLTFRKPLLTVSKESIVESLPSEEGFRYPSLRHELQYEFAKSLIVACNQSADNFVQVSLKDLHYLENWI